MIPAIHRHNCPRHHRAYPAFAKCVWKHARWVEGDGPYAVLARCGVLTVRLYRGEEAAWTAKADIDATKCGNSCRGAHELVWLDMDHEDA